MAQNENINVVLKAFKNCQIHSFNFTNYKRDFLRPENWLIANDLNSGLNEKVKGTLRGKTLFTKKMDEAFEKAKSEEKIEEMAEAKAIFHEGLFLIGRKENATNEWEMKRYAQIQTENTEKIQRAYEHTLSIVEANDIGDLQELEKSRDIFLGKLPIQEDWMRRVFVNGYCEGLIRSCAVASGIEIETEEVIQLILNYKFANPSSSGCGAAERKVRSLIRAYAFVIDSLDKKREIDIEFVQQIHAQAFEQNEKMLEEGEKFGGRIVREGKRLETLLAWLNSHFLTGNDCDPVTMATIAHYGIFLLQPFMDGNHRCGRLLQDFILMHFGYPPACIFDEEIAEYLEKTEEARRFEGADLRPFLRFISAKCMPKTFEALLHKKIDHPELLTEYRPIEGVYNGQEGGGWSAIFKVVLGALNPELLHF